VAVSGETLEADMVRVDGEQRDSVVLTKNARSPECHTDADCDDDTPCTVDTCQADGCHHDVVTPDAVRGSIPAAATAGACANESLPRFVVGLLNRATRTVERAAGASDPNRAGRQMTVAARQLDALGRRAGLAANRRHVSVACASALAAMASSAESRAQCLASRQPPAADTYIESRKGKENHGAAAELKVDASPMEVTYLKFDLSAVPSVRRATLELHVTNKSPDAGQVYRIPDSAWREGSGNDVDVTTDKGPGLNWDEVDTDTDKVLDAGDASPLVPEPDEMIGKIGAVHTGETVRVNVTQALQGGPGVYTLAIMSGSSNGARFASREYPRASWRPALRILR
jgi:hypothetical protein